MSPSSTVRTLIAGASMLAASAAIAGEPPTLVAARLFAALTFQKNHCQVQVNAPKFNVVLANMGVTLNQVTDNPQLLLRAARIIEENKEEPSRNSALLWGMFGRDGHTIADLVTR